MHEQHMRNSCHRASRHSQSSMSTMHNEWLKRSPVLWLCSRYTALPTTWHDSETPWVHKPESHGLSQSFLFPPSSSSTSITTMAFTIVSQGWTECGINSTARVRGYGHHLASRSFWRYRSHQSWFGYMEGYVHVDKMLQAQRPQLWTFFAIFHDVFASGYHNSGGCDPLWGIGCSFGVVNCSLAPKDDVIEIGEVVLWVDRRRETRCRTGSLVDPQR